MIAFDTMASGKSSRVVAGFGDLLEVGTCFKWQVDDGSWPSEIGWKLGLGTDGPRNADGTLRQDTSVEGGAGETLYILYLDEVR